MSNENNHVGLPWKKKNNNKFLFFIIIIITFLIALIAANYYIAMQFNFDSRLGNFLFPWKFWAWYQLYGNHYPEIFHMAFSILIVTITLVMIILLIYKNIITNTNKKYDSLHGSARWANKNDILKAGLLNNNQNKNDDGVYVGAWEDEKGNLQYLRSTGSEHVLCYAPTRSGKGIALVLPTLLSWRKSTVVTDLKGELWALTAGWRKSIGNKVLKFEPASSHGSACWNPLDEIRINTDYETGDVQNLATLIVDPDGKGLDDHWQKTGKALLEGIILYTLLKTEQNNKNAEDQYELELETYEVNLKKFDTNEINEKPKKPKKPSLKIANLNEVDNYLTNQEESAAVLWDDMIEFKYKRPYETYQHSSNGESIPLIFKTGRDMSDRPEEEAGSVLSTTKSHLNLYRDPVVSKNTSKSTFKINDLMNFDNPVSLYIISEPTDKDRLKPLIRILISMIFKKLAVKQEFKDARPVAKYKHKLLCMFDEFPSLGKLSIVQETLAFIASYGIKCYLICQDINQLKSEKTGYGHDEQITSNCHIQNAFPPNRIETAEHLSKLTGTTTIVKESITTSGKRTNVMLGGVSKTTQEVQRPLLTPDEAMRLKGPIKDNKGMIVEAGAMVIYVAGYPAIYGKQILYFKDPVFSQRASIIAPKYTDILYETNE